jgi:hypothetical protein
MIGQLRCHGLECEPRQGTSPLEARDKGGEQRDVPPRWEGLDASEELRPYQEPGSRGKTREGEMFRGEIVTRALHEWIPLAVMDDEREA